MHDVEWGYVNRDGFIEEQLTTDMLRDSTLEWGRLWYYYGQGAGRWNFRRWNFGPFNGLSLSNWEKNPCYSDDRKIATVLPNGLLWQQNQINGWLGGLNRIMSSGERLILTASDCSDGPFVHNNYYFATDRL